MDELVVNNAKCLYFLMLSYLTINYTINEKSQQN